jgi:plastocyanin
MNTRPGRNRLMTMRTALVALALVALVAAACQAEDETTGATPAPGDHFVNVTLTEHAIELPDSAPAGEVSFQLRNDGDMDHRFAIEGNGVEDAIRVAISPGATETWTIELEPGTYTVWCPIGDHRERGMEAQIEITEAADDADAPLRDEAVDPGDEPDDLDEDQP